MITIFAYFFCNHIKYAVCVVLFLNNAVYFLSKPVTA